MGIFDLWTYLPNFCVLLFNISTYHDSKLYIHSNSLLPVPISSISNVWFDIVLWKRVLIAYVWFKYIQRFLILRILHVSQNHVGYNEWQQAVLRVSDEKIAEELKDFVVDEDEGGEEDSDGEKKEGEGWFSFLLP